MISSMLPQFGAKYLITPKKGQQISLSEITDRIDRQRKLKHHTQNDNGKFYHLEDDEIYFETEAEQLYLKTSSANKNEIEIEQEALDELSEKLFNSYKKINEIPYKYYNPFYGTFNLQTISPNK